MLHKDVKSLPYQFYVSVKTTIFIISQNGL